MSYLIIEANDGPFYVVEDFKQIDNYLDKLFSGMIIINLDTKEYLVDLTGEGLLWQKIAEK